MLTEYYRRAKRAAKLERRAKECEESIRWLPPTEESRATRQALHARADKLRADAVALMGELTK